MKAIWKVLLGTAAVAAVAPYSVKKDEETGEVQLKAAVWSAKYTKSEDGPSLSVRLLPLLSKKEEECCCDEDECCCEEHPEEEEDGITIEVEESADEPEADHIPDSEEPRPEEA